MRSLSIAIVLDDKFPSSSGVSRSVQTQIEELSKIGHNITLIAPRTDLEAPNNIRIIPVKSIKFPGLPLHTRILCASWKSAKDISRKHSFDIVHSQTDTGALLLAAKISKIQNIPHIHTFHTNIAGSHTMIMSTFFASIGFRIYALIIAHIHKRYLNITHHKASMQLSKESRIGRFDWHTQAIIARAVNYSTTPSHYMFNYIRELCANIYLPGAIIPTGYNRTFEAYTKAIKRQRSDNKIRFISISRLVKEKRLDVIIKAFKQATIPNSELYIVGDGAEYKRLIHLAENSPNIIFTGHISNRKEIVQLLRDADIFVLASYRFDNQPIVIPESLVVGLPIIYCDDRLDVGLNNSNSLLVDPSITGLAEGMTQIAKPHFHKKLATGTKSVFSELSPQATAKSYIDIYTQTISKYNNSNKN